jgi:hypothetical protein
MQRRIAAGERQFLQNVVEHCPSDGFPLEAANIKQDTSNPERRFICALPKEPLTKCAKFLWSAAFRSTQKVRA